MQRAGSARFTDEAPVFERSAALDAANGTVPAPAGAEGLPARRRRMAAEARLRSEVNNSLIIVNFFHRIQNFRQISDLFSQI